MGDSTIDIFAIILGLLLALWITTGSGHISTATPLSQSQQTTTSQWQQVDDLAQRLEQKAGRAERYFK